MQIEIITREDCSACNNFKSLLKQHNQPYSEVVIGKDIKREDVLQAFGPGTPLPIVWFDKIRATNPVEQFTEIVAHANTFRDMLREKIVPLRFVKKDGTVREMQATLHPDHLPAGWAEVFTNTKPRHVNHVRVFDMEKQAFRTINTNQNIVLLGA